MQGRIDKCPHCGADLNGAPIPDDIKHHYAPPYRWRREIAQVCPERDRVVAYRCPDCRKEWAP